MKLNRIDQLASLAFILISISTLPGCGSGGNGPDGNSSTGASATLVWDQGNWDQKTWQ